MLAFYLISFAGPATAIFSVIFFLAEAFGALFALFFVFLFFPRKRRSAVPPPKVGPSFQPAVDVFVCTYSEPFKLVLASALAASNLPYENKKVFICDDGCREELAMLAERFGIGYITRPDSAHAKAGNINHALSVTSGELIMLLDADFIVKPRMILEALPWFSDETMAMVQYPQSFYNKAHFQMLRRGFFNEQDFFMRYIEPRLAEHGALIHVGTNAILRRSAVQAIGGVPTKSITEDMTTGMLLQKRRLDEDVEVEGARNKVCVMSFDGFRLPKPPGGQPQFTPGQFYEFRMVRTGLVSGAEYVGESSCTLEFAYKNVTKEAAYRLNRFCVEKLHAAKQMDFDRETEEVSPQ